MKDLPTGVTAKIVDTDEVKTNLWRGAIVLVLQRKEDGQYYVIATSTGNRAILPRENLVQVERRWVEVIEEVE